MAEVEHKYGNNDFPADQARRRDMFIAANCPGPWPCFRRYIVKKPSAT